VVNARFAKPLDAALITRLIQSGKPMLVCEDHAVAGGFGSAVLELAADRGLRAENVRLVGLPDRYVSFASRREQLTEVGLDSAHLSAALWDLIRAERHAAQAP
jgi:1-deoxy-D-xylulose-5-phosphate synthase